MERSDSQTKSRGSDSKGKEICTEDQLPKEIKEESCNSCEPTKLDFSACVKELEGMIKQNMDAENYRCVTSASALTFWGHNECP